MGEFNRDPWAMVSRHKHDLYRIEITCSETSPIRREVADLLAQMPNKWTACPTGFRCSSKALWFALYPLGNSETKHIPACVRSLDTSYLGSLLKWAWKTDGSVEWKGRKTKQFRVETTSAKLADDYQSILVRLGYRVSVSEVPSHTGAILYRIRFSRGRWANVQRTRLVDYDGYVYCPTVPNGTICVRRNGRIYWTGNSPQTESQVQIIRRHIQNELEGQAKLSLITGMKKPEVVDVQPVNEADLLLNWQELLIRMIANGFDMSAMALGVEHDINRAVGEVLDDKDFRSAVVPTARRLQEGFTRKILHEKLGWYDLEFVFLNLDDPDIETKIEMYSRLYSMNSITPNQICKGLNRPPLTSPFADLTQFECMLLNIQAMETQQNQLADAGVQRQFQVAQLQQQLMGPPETPDTEPPPDQGPPGRGQPPQRPGGPPGASGRPSTQGPSPGGGGNGESLTPGNVSRGGQPPSPKALSLPKFPIAGSKYNARQVARMPINQITDVFKFARASDLLTQMDEQEPGILETLSDEVKEYFKERLAEEQQSRKPKPFKPGLVKKWTKELATRKRKSDSRESDMAQYLQDQGKVVRGNPGLAGKKPTAGHPGDVNPIRKG